VHKYNAQLNEAKKQKNNCEVNDKKLHEYFNCQISKLNMAYDSAIKIINEKRKQFTEILKQRLVDEKRQVELVKSKITKKIERLSEAIKPLKEASTKLEHIPYEELYQILLQKNAEFKQIVEESIRSIPESVFACFKDSLKLSDLGSIQYFKAAEIKDFIISNSKNKPAKEEKYKFDYKNHKKERKLNHTGKLFAPEFAGTPSNEEAYLYTCCGKDNYYAMNQNQLPTRTNVTLNKQKSSKDNSNALGRDSAILSPQVKEVTVPKYGGSNYQSKVNQRYSDKVMIESGIPLSAKNELISNGSLKLLEHNENENKNMSLDKESLVDYEKHNASKEILAQNDLNTEAKDDYDRTIQRSISTLQKQSHTMKYATLNKETVKEIVQPKQKQLDPDEPALKKRRVSIS